MVTSRGITEIVINRVDITLTIYIKRIVKPLEIKQAKITRTTNQVG